MLLTLKINEYLTLKSAKYLCRRFMPYFHYAFFPVFSDSWLAIFLFLGAFSKLRRATISFVISVRLSVCLSVHPHETTRLPMDRFSWNLVFHYFSNICLENSSFFTIGQIWSVFYLKTDIRFWLYFANFILEWKMLHTKIVEKIITYILLSNIYLNHGLYG